MSTNGRISGTKEIKSVPTCCNRDTTEPPTVVGWPTGHLLEYPVFTFQCFVSLRDASFIFIFLTFYFLFARSRWSFRGKTIFKEWASYFQRCISKSKSQTLLYCLCKSNLTVWLQWTTFFQTTVLSNKKCRHDCHRLCVRQRMCRERNLHQTWPAKKSVHSSSLLIMLKKIDKKGWKEKQNEATGILQIM